VPEVPEPRLVVEDQLPDVDVEGLHAQVGSPRAPAPGRSKGGHARRGVEFSSNPAGAKQAV
jgi:hypothetical protein